MVVSTGCFVSLAPYLYWFVLCIGMFIVVGPEIMVYMYIVYNKRWFVNNTTGILMLAYNK